MCKCHALGYIVAGYAVEQQAQRNRSPVIGTIITGQIQTRHIGAGACATVRLRQPMARLQSQGIS